MAQKRDVDMWHVLDEASPLAREWRLLQQQPMPAPPPPPPANQRVTRATRRTLDAAAIERFVPDTIPTTALGV